jgi:TolA-binding protein
MDAAGAGELLTTISGMAGATKAVAEAVRAVKAKVKGNAEAEKAVSEAFDQVLSLQDRMIDLQEKILRLQAENAGLREQIRSEEKRAAERQKYKKKKVGQAVVLVTEEEPDTYLCPTCFETRGRAIPIQAHPSRTGTFGTHFCSTCETSFRLHG